MKIILRLMFTKQLWIGGYKFFKMRFKNTLKGNSGGIDMKIFNPKKINFLSKPFEKYGYQMSMLNTLLEREMITKTEYEKIKIHLKNKYKVA